LPEPILTETVTDIDSDERGELELAANGLAFRARRGGAFSLDASVEAEWIVHRLVGVRVEPTFALSRDAGQSSSATELGASAGVAFKLFQDFERSLFVQAEVLARLPWDESAIVQPGDPALPLAIDVRAATRRGPLTLRWGIGAGAYGEAAHYPLRGSVAALLPFEGTGRLGFWGLEVDVDGARTAPLVAAPNLVTKLPGGIPLRLGLALPLAIGETAERPSFGFLVRVYYESDRETSERDR
jgi:hypothetical protein